MGVYTFIKVDEVYCRKTGGTVIGAKKYQKLIKESDFVSYIAKLIYSIHSATGIFDEPSDWATYFDKKSMKILKGKFDLSRVKVYGVEDESGEFMFKVLL